MRSIRRSLLVPLLFGVPLLLLLAAGASSWLIANELRADFDRALRDKAVGLAALTQRVGNTAQLDFDFSDELMPEFSRKDHPEYFELWTAGRGDVVERSRSLGRAQLPRLRNIGAAPRTQNYQLPDGRAGRLVELTFAVERDDADQREPTSAAGLANEKAKSEADPVVVIALARGTDELERLIEVVIAVYVGSALVLAVAIIVLLRVVLKRGLQPLVSVAAQVAAIDADKLDHRITLMPPVQELALIVSRINELLGSVGTEMERERQFSANVAHELRTPVAELKSLAEVRQRWPADAAEGAAFAADALAIADQLERTVEQLLALSRADAGLESIVHESVAVGSLVTEVWSSLQATLAPSRLRLVMSVPSAMVVSTDRAKLTLVLRNLLGNAGQFSPSGADIEVAGAAVEGAGWSLQVVNDAPELDAADLPRLFDRFWRKDEARTDGGHVGLGLSLVRSTARLLGVEVSATLSSTGRLTILLASN